MVSPNTEVIFTQCTAMWEKYLDLSKGYWNPKGNLGVTTQFSKIILLVIIKD